MHFLVVVQLAFSAATAGILTHAVCVWPISMLHRVFYLTRWHQQILQLRRRKYGYRPFLSVSRGILTRGTSGHDRTSSRYSVSCPGFLSLLNSKFLPTTPIRSVCIILNIL
nr:PREDICTED: uncharacterized protein LOC105663183 isoform X1 [Megachile rotundata]